MRGLIFFSLKGLNFIFVSEFTGCSIRMVTPNKVVSTINNTEYFKNYEAANVQQIEQAVKQTLSNKQEKEKYHYLYELMRLVYATGQINKVGWDLHTENVMMRKNGELVIIDPWFAMNEGS